MSLEDRSILFFILLQFDALSKKICAGPNQGALIDISATAYVISSGLLQMSDENLTSFFFNCRHQWYYVIRNMRSRVTLSIRDLDSLHIEVGAELLIHYANSKFVIGSYVFNSHSFRSTYLDPVIWISFWSGRVRLL